MASDQALVNLEFMLQNLNSITIGASCTESPETKVTVRNCSTEQVDKIDQSLKFLIPELRKKIELLKNYGNQKLTSADGIFYNKVRKTFDCIHKKIEKKMKFECIDSYLCRDPYNYYMYVSPTPDQVFKDNLIRTCSDFTNDKAVFIAGIIIHEVSHLCGTEDHEYLGKRNAKMTIKPKLSYPEGDGELNADSFRYWFENGFCIPEKDC